MNPDQVEPRSHLDQPQIIMDIADDLFNDCKISEHDSYQDEIWERKYICNTYDMNKTEEKVY